MLVRLLGAHDLQTDTTHHTCFLIDGVLAIDAGSIATTSDRDEQIALRHVLLTHLHFDHTRDIPPLALQTLDESSSIDVYSLQITLDSVLDHLLDGTKYPGLSLPLNDTPAAVNFREINDANTFTITEYSVKPIPVLHPVPTIGYIISSPTGSVANTSQPGVDEHHRQRH